VLISSDAAEGMLEVARSRAREFGIDNVEFKRLQLEWIDLPAARVDAVLCRWGIMLVVDPGAAASEIRRVLRPGGRAALAVWDAPERNPWATIPNRALVELGHAEPPDPSQPGMFALAAPGSFRELLESAGFVEVVTDAVGVDHDYINVEEYIAETLDCSRIFSDTWERLTEDERSRLRKRIGSGAAEFRAGDGSLHLPGRSLVAGASA
jgi:SAM-dependent methyltransferase